MRLHPLFCFVRYISSAFSLGLTSLQALQDWPNGMAPDLSVCHSLAIDSQVSTPLIRDFQLNSTIPADGMFPEVSIGDVMNTTGGFLCYVYE